MLFVSLFTIAVGQSIRCKTHEDCDIVKDLTPNGMVSVGHKECDTDDDCYKKYTNSIPGILKCLDGYCVSPINPQVPDKIE
ncbi:hypothetical protein P8452_64769 [Trifolium repens]|nr:hypothetical protein P8452_64769 [Trifolium repens]